MQIKDQDIDPPALTQLSNLKGKSGLNFDKKPNTFFEDRFVIKFRSNEGDAETNYLVDALQ